MNAAACDGAGTVRTLSAYACSGQYLDEDILGMKSILGGSCLDVVLDECTVTYAPSRPKTTSDLDRV